MSSLLQVFELNLEEDGSPGSERAYVRLPPPVKPYVLRFTIEAGGSACRDGRLWTNFPPRGSEFDRKKFWEHKLPTDFSKPIQLDLWITHAGVFEFYVEHAAPIQRSPYPTKEQPICLGASGMERVKSKRGYFNVDPLLRLPKRTPVLGGNGGMVLKDVINLPQDGIVLQSFVAKWAGGLSSWGPHLDLARDSGYNMWHFLPLQVRGQSNSPYSLADQLDFSLDLFDAKAGASKTRADRFKTMQTWLNRIRSEWGILSMTDVVLNHTANNTPWLYQHPDAGYNIVNSPHLTPAEELDRKLMEFSASLSALNLPTRVTSQSDVDAIMSGVKAHVLNQLELWQYYVIDVEAHTRAFQTAWGQSDAALTKLPEQESLDDKGLDDASALLQKHALRNRMALSSRYCTDIEIGTAIGIMRSLGRSKPDGDVFEAFKKALDAINVPLYTVYDDDLKAITANLEGRLKYQRLDPRGPQLGEISPSSPFCEPYFTRLDPKDPRAKGQNPKSLALAHNGWIWAADPLVDFGTSASRVYLRRELISWGDCVKLRFGKGPEDSPFLWKHMEEYVKSIAVLFDGFRIDNCHSTPIHVGEFLLDAARKVNPNLYVCAELFTGSAEMDVYFVSRLGINSLIREMDNANDPKEESRLLYRFGVNKPVGSMDDDCLAKESVMREPLKGKAVKCIIKPLLGSSPHALFMDITHDNETPTAKRTTIDALTMGALVAFSWSAIGSTRGFDELYPKHLDVVQEKRQYRALTSVEQAAIGPVRRILNHLHTEMVLEGYAEGHMHQENDYIIVHRIHPVTHKGYVIVARTAFHDSTDERGFLSPIILKRTKVYYIFGKTLRLKGAVQEDERFLCGIPSELVDIAAPELRAGKDHDGTFTEIVIPDCFPSASVMIFATEMDGIDANLETLCKSGAAEALAPLDLVDLNIVLHRAEGEERDITGGADGAYVVPGYGPFVYCGLEGWMPALRQIMEQNDLGHALCAHLREGTWAMDYCVNRLQRHMNLFPRLRGIHAWLEERFNAVKTSAPPFMRPKYCALIINSAYTAARERTLSQMSAFVADGHEFTKSLALCAVQMNGMVKSASLWPDKHSASMAAGLPFFAAGWARLWGRDVFISLRGLYLTTGMYQAAHDHIISFGSTLKHGLIPNLLDSTRTPRYNCRDGPWFFAQNVQDYTTMVPGGEAILQEKVKRRFPADDTWVPWDSPQAFAYSSTVAELIQEILQRHATGIHFREYNAGPAIDNDMKDEGFNIDIDVDWKTGIIFGGNRYNCGTWQDKNGSSQKAGNKGHPSTPRDGAAIEITALLKSTLRWVSALSKQGKWPAKGVEATIDGRKTKVTYAEWDALLAKSFERCYWVPLDPAEDKTYDIDPQLVNRRGIYKDVYGSGTGREWSDYQLRANFPIAMTVAPELFDPQHAITALQAADNVLRAPLGMRTLDPSDMNYRGDYDNTNDSDDYRLAAGANYHQGPEWLWLTGEFLRAYLHFDSIAGSGRHDKAETFHRVSSMMLQHKKHIQSNPWAGLPELTNSNGTFCVDSCRTQAWSASTMLDTLEEMMRLQKNTK
ncbi:glycoside hydrolase family 133 protein [Tilletiaria anomala UBC 951]|uniref:Glycogen debranching enzyme n=1 Tax=Tilletiaria anomala (strain ATCC 24038 / CBS 436.72 / UBC 951) TaxID=1037660 RepID=A0A066VPH2_TILAU|nr:glycoside hydrolase family 133 protein [Tilletiaria anomala UBC 951]KDN43331.1 glycoside hydrolase family 133 protein [Tilletiaria anomala UBC 951]